jgi:CheY-like chemotaxis protein
MRKKSALVVEYHGPTRMMLAAALDRLGEDAVMSVNGAEALAILEHRDDIALLVIGQLGQAGMTGAELGHIVAGRWPQLQVIFGPLSTDEARLSNAMTDEARSTGLSSELIGGFSARIAALMATLRI